MDESVFVFLVGAFGLALGSLQYVQLVIKKSHQEQSTHSAEMLKLNLRLTKATAQRDEARQVAQRENRKFKDERRINISLRKELKKYRLPSISSSDDI